MPAHGSDAINAKRGHRSRFRGDLNDLRQRNFIYSPFLRLPVELILDIILHAFQLHGGFRFWVILTAICYRLREILVSSPFLWRVVDTDSVPLAKAFLARSNFDPHALLATNHVWPPHRTAFWDELGGRTLKNLRFFVFRGPKSVFERWVVDVLQRTPNLASLEIEGSSRAAWDLKQSFDDQLPNLTMLRLNKVRISWTSPLLQNLTKLILNFACMRTPQEFTPLQTFLSALKNCPDLESLQLNSAGPDPPSDTEDDLEVVPLHKLQDLALRFEDQDVVMSILSYIWFPESAKVEVETFCYHGIYASLSQVLPPPDVETLEYLQKTTTISINLTQSSYELATDSFRLVLIPEDDEYSHQSNLETLPRFAAKVVEMTGGDSVTALHVVFGLPGDVPRGMWEELLHGFPRLEVIRYSSGPYSSGDSVDPFCSVFSEPFEGGFVCPGLSDLRVPHSVSWGPSALALRQALLERDAGGRRLKRISFGDQAAGGMILLEPFRDVVDEVSWFCPPGSQSSSSSSRWAPVRSSFFSG